MRKIFKGLFIFIFIAVQMPNCALGQSVTPEISITEIGVFEPSETEWVEILNKSSAPIDLTGWKFFEEDTNHGLTAANGDFIIEAGEYAVIVNKADLFKVKYPDFSGTILDSSWGNLKEEGELIGLKDSGGNFVEQFTYPQIADVEPQNDSSIERIDLENWKFALKNSLGKQMEVAQENPQPPAQTETPVNTETVNTEISDATNPPETAPVNTTENSNQPAETPPVETVQTNTQATPAPKINNPPQAIIQVQSGSLTAYESTTINFDGRASFDPDGDKLNFLWDLGDGEQETSANPGLHKYDQLGIYTVILTVTDPFGAQGKAQTSVQVLGTPIQSTNLNAPVAITQIPQTVAAAVPQALPANLQNFILPSSSPNSVIELHGYFVFGDGSTQTTTTKKAATKTTTIKKTTKKSTKVAFKNGDLSDKIQITELFPAPDASDENGEWIEIFNGGSKPVNLGNWQIFDTSKKASPYLIPDTFAIQPRSYMVFKKTETKISLNNGSDEIFIADFNGKVIDSVEYEKAKKTYSYALIQTSTQVDSLSPRFTDSALAKAENWEWQWTDQPTPGQPNPVFENIFGTVSAFVAGGGPYENLLTLTMQNGETRDANLSADVLDPKIAETVLTPGTQVSLQAQKHESGSYEIKKIEDVKPPSAPPEKEKNYFMWIIFGVIAVGIVLNASPLIRAIREKLKNRSNAKSQPEPVKEENSLKLGE